MKKLNVCVVSVNAPPNTGAESLQVGMMLKYLAPNVNVNLVTAQTEKHGWKKADPQLEVYTKDIVARIELEAVPGRLEQSLKRRLNVAPKFPQHSPRFHLQEKAVFKTLSTKPDVIYSRMQPVSSALLACKLRGHYKVPWVMHLSDPWSTNLNFNPKHKAQHIKAERECIEKADAISVTSEQTKKLFSEAHPDMAQKFIVLPNMYDPTDVIPKAMDFASPKLKLVHAGNLYGIVSVKPFFDALEMVRQQQPDLLEHIDITFAGNMTEANIQAFSTFNHPNVKYVGSLPFRDAIELQKQAHTLMFIDRPLKDWKEGVHMHSKVQIAMALGKPMLGLGEHSCATCEYVEGKYGKCFDFSETEQLHQYLIDAITAYRNKNAAFFETNPIDDFYAADNNADKLLNIFNKLVS